MYESLRPSSSSSSRWDLLPVIPSPQCRAATCGEGRGVRKQKAPASSPPGTKSRPLRGTTLLGRGMHGPLFPATGQARLPAAPLTVGFRGRLQAGTPPAFTRRLGRELPRASSEGGLQSVTPSPWRRQRAYSLRHSLCWREYSTAGGRGQEGEGGTETPRHKDTKTLRSTKAGRMERLMTRK